MLPLTCILILLTIYYLCAVMYLHRGLRSLKPSGDPQNLTYSIIIAARNEAANIAKCLDSIFAQTISRDRYEVIVVNDRSTDATPDICERYALNHPSLSVISIAQTPEGVAPKKHAVVTGVKAARNEIIVQTDADCIVGPDWLAAIDRNFTRDTGLVQGVTSFARTDGMNGVFFGLQAVDFLSHGIVAAAAIGAGMPINSNANNFAFRRKAFDSLGGYGSVAAKVVSGDDDLLLQRIAGSKQWKVAFMADPKGAVVTAPAMTMNAVFEQRKRWGSKTVNYTPGQAAFLGGVFLFYCGLVTAFCAGFLSPTGFAIFAGMLTIKILGEFMLMIPGTGIFDRKELRPFILPASIIQLPMVLAAVVLGVFGKFSWKGERFGRTVK